MSYEYEEFEGAPFKRPKVADLKRWAKASALELQNEGRVLRPVTTKKTGIASTRWGQAWCKRLAELTDTDNRLNLGRSYLRNGCVIDLQQVGNRLTGLVQGEFLYETEIKVCELEQVQVSELQAKLQGAQVNLVDVLAGQLSEELMVDLTVASTGLFPALSELKMICSCLDDAIICKHTAALLYGFAIVLDRDTDSLFRWRGVDALKLVQGRGSELSNQTAQDAKKSVKSGDTGPDLTDDDLSKVFGIELG